MESSTNMNPWLHIWTKPYQTISGMIRDNRKWQMIVAILLFGFSFILEQAAAQSLGDMFPTGELLTLTLFLAPLFGFAIWFIFSGVSFGIGRLLGGSGRFKDLRIATAWASLIFSLKLILWIPQSLLFGSEMFLSTMPVVSQSASLSSLFLFLTVFDLLIIIWFYIIASKSIGIAHRFSAWKGFATLLLSFISVMVTFFLLFFAIDMAS